MKYPAHTPTYFFQLLNRLHFPFFVKMVVAFLAIKDGGTTFTMKQTKQLIAIPDKPVEDAPVDSIVIYIA